MRGDAVSVTFREIEFRDYSQMLKRGGGRPTTAVKVHSGTYLSSEYTHDD